MEKSAHLSTLRRLRRVHRSFASLKMTMFNSQDGQEKLLKELLRVRRELRVGSVRAGV
jgi:hypothetical protein